LAKPPQDQPGPTSAENQRSFAADVDTWRVRLCTRALIHDRLALPAIVLVLS